MLAAPPGSTVVFNAANEIAVQAFLEERIRFDQIYVINAETLQQTSFQTPATLQDLMALDGQARAVATSLAQKVQK